MEQQRSFSAPMTSVVVDFCCRLACALAPPADVRQLNCFCVRNAPPVLCAVEVDALGDRWFPHLGPHQLPGTLSPSCCISFTSRFIALLTGPRPPTHCSHALSCFLRRGPCFKLVYDLAVFHDVIFIFICYMLHFPGIRACCAFQTETKSSACFVQIAFVPSVPP